jgi:hypothetical protein
MQRMLSVGYCHGIRSDAPTVRKSFSRAKRSDQQAGMPTPQPGAGMPPFLKVQGKRQYLELRGIFTPALLSFHHGDCRHSFCLTPVLICDEREQGKT